MHRITRTMFSLLILIALLTNRPINTIYAQTPTITLSIAVEGYIKDQFFDADGRQLIRDFESAHPGVKLNLITSNGFYWTPASSSSPEDYFQKLEKYANSADVLAVSSFTTTPEAVHGGYFLDLTPYVAADKNFDVSDFYPATLQSFQFDNGLWGLPNTTGNVTTLNYDPAAFDEAGLTYPTEKWTIDDFANAARKLVKRDAAGNVVRYGFDAIFDDDLLRSLLAQGAYDTNTLPNQPALDRPDVVELMKKWAALRKEGIIGPKYSARGEITLNAPFSVDNPFNSDDVHKNMVSILLPSGKSGLIPQGYAVSAGSHYPQLAYELAEYLTTRPTDWIAHDRYAARQSVTKIALAQDNSQSQSGFSDEQKMFYEKALQRAIPFSELRYMAYGVAAIYKASQDNTIDVEHTLQEAQIQALKYLQLAQQKHQTIVLNVVSPPDSAPLVAGQIALKFAVGTNELTVPNMDTWNAVARTFTASDTQAKQIVIDSTGNSSLADLTKKYDCFYLPQSPLQRAQPGQLLNLDPLVDVDKTFNRADVLPGVLTSLQADNRLWGYPLTITPLMLRYDSRRFTQNGITVPDTGWQVDTFADTLKTLHTANGSAVLGNGYSTVGGTPLLMLIAAYGGLPIDYRTNPPTINFTDPINAAAIKQVLDLVKQGYIPYKALGNSDFTNASAPDAAIFAEYLDDQQLSALSDNYKLTPFPHSSHFTPLAFDVGAAYISANAPSVDGCYRWISTLVQHPELFGALPARQAAADTPAWATLHGATIAAFYKQYTAQLNAPNALIFPSIFSTPYIGLISERWLYRAFDAYVLKSTDLTSALSDAQSYASAFLTCMGGNGTIGDAYYQQINTCMNKVDPTINVQPGK